MTAPHDDRPLADANPWPQHRVGSLPVQEAGRALLAEIVATPVLDRPDVSAPGRQRPRWLMPVAVAAAVLLVVGVPLYLTRGGGGPDPSYAASATRVAQANPRLLVSAPGWQVARVESFTATEGEMTFTDGDHELDVHWRAARDYQGYLADRSHGNTSGPVEVLGQQGTLFAYGGTDFTTILPPQGASFLEVRGDLGSRQAYLEVLRSLTPVSVDTWLAAMPDNVVQPGDMDATVAEMLKGMPLPPGFDAQPLSRDLPSERYQVGAQVAGAVACAWLDRWDDAHRDGDAQAERTALEAMQTSKHWPVLLQMNAEGDYPEVVWELADGIAGRKREFFGGLPTRTTWTQGLGCDIAPRDANVSR